MTTPDLTPLLEDYARAQPNRALGGVRALSGFEYQLRVYLADFAQALAGGEGLQQKGEGFAHALETLSDHTRRDGNLTVCVQVKRTLTTSALAEAAAEFALIDEFLGDRLQADARTKVRYECVARGGDPTLGWDAVRLPGKVTATRPELQGRFADLRAQGRLRPPRIEKDPWWRLIVAVYRRVDDPFAFAREALDLCLRRGPDADGARRVRDAIADGFARRRTAATPSYDYLLPEDLASPAQAPPDLEVGVPPTLQTLRDAQFMERPGPLRQVREALDAMVRERERPAYRRLDLFWIDGRSGSGKSVLLLQLMASLVREGARVLWLRDRTSQLLGRLRDIEANAPKDGPEYIFVDDLYDPQRRAKLEVDEIVSLVTHRPDLDWPLVVTCGPPEFHQHLTDDAGGRLRPRSWRIPAVDPAESLVLRQWFTHRTGRAGAPGSAFDQDQGLMISMMFELRHGDLEQLAHRFRGRLEQAGLKEALYQPLALNRLYIWSPANWLTDVERAQLEEINQDDDFSFLSTAATGSDNRSTTDDSGYLKLTHPHLSDIIYQTIRRPAVRSLFTDDLVTAFAHALKHDPQIAVRLLRTFPAQPERLQILDQERLATGCAARWRDAGSGAAIVSEGLRTELRVQWALWCAVRTGLARRLGVDPVDDACAALAGGHPQWGRLWHALAAAYPNTPKVLEIGVDWVKNPQYFATPSWSFLWETLLDSDWRAIPTAPDRLAELIDLGRSWLRGREDLPDWNYVWQRLVRGRDPLPADTLGPLLRQGWVWLAGREDAPGWAHVWERLVEHRAGLPAGVAADHVLRRGHEWLKGRGETPEWSHVWEFLLRHREELPEGVDAAALYRTGADWLAGREETPQWSHVWQFLLEHRAEWPDGIDAGALYRAGADWLGGREKTPEWAFVWRFLLEHRDEWPEGIEAGALYRTGADWLAGREDTPEWSFVWQFLWEQRSALGMETESADLLQAVSNWLLIPQNRGRGEWDKLFETTLDAGHAPEELLRAGADWIRANRNQPQSPILAQKLLTVANPEAAWADELAGYLADWLTTHANQPIAGKMLHVMLKNGIAAGSEQPPPVPSPGWRQLANALRELTTAPRAFITDHAVGDIVTGKIAARAKKGYLVHLDETGRVAAFLPGSQLDLTRPTDWDAPVGRCCDLEIIEIDPESLSIMVSCRALLERERQAARNALIASLKEGQIIEGTIANIRDFGLFVDIGGINGLLHRSRLADPPRGDLARSYSRGQRIRV